MYGIQDMVIEAPVVIAAGAAFIPVCVIMVGLRFYVRYLQTSRYGLDDWCILGALIFVIAMGVVLIVESAEGNFGYAAKTKSTVWDGTPNANLPFWITEILQIPALGLVKLSFLFLYRRIFVRVAAKRFHWISVIIMIIMAAWTVAFCVAFLFICKGNFAAYWESTVIEAAQCVHTGYLHNGLAISDVVTDFIVLILPIPEIWRLQLPTGRKIAVLGVFFLGVLTLVMSAVRAGILIAADSQNYDPNIDFESAYWCMVESGLGLCAACLPVQWGLLQRHKQRSQSKSKQSLGSQREAHSMHHRRLNSDVAMEYVRPKAVSPLPPSTSFIRFDSDLELQRLDESKGIVVTRSFHTGQAF